MVGVYYTDSIGDYAALAEHWNGNKWALESVPGAPGAYLNWVSCPATTSCEAVGNHLDQTGTLVPFVVGWNGHKWALQQFPEPAGASDFTPEIISCSAPNACTAISLYIDSTGAWVPVADRWDGTEWTLQSMPVPSGATLTYIYGVSCPAADACTAAGFYGDAAGIDLTLTERWDGTAWTIEPSPNPPGSVRAALDDVSCADTTACTAMGFWTDSSGVDHVLAEARR
jgi:hypothetical protein